MLAIREQAELLGEEIIDFRHALHRIPEIGLDLPRTQQLILEKLAHLEGIEILRGDRQSSVTVVLRGGRMREDGSPGPVVLLRGDMDALPVTEETGLAYASETAGAMHACGHDMHVAALYGALKLLHELRGDLCGDVLFMFQPGEEAYDGARFMVEDGVLEAAGRKVDAAFGLHVFPVISGTVSFTPGQGHSWQVVMNFSSPSRVRAGMVRPPTRPRILSPLRAKWFWHFKH